MVVGMKIRSPRGFTLLEVMVTLVLIGIIVTFAGLSIGGDPRDRAQREARRLQALLQLALEEAQVHRVLMGWEETERGYRFLLWNEGTWEPYDPPSPFRERILPAPLRLSPAVEAMPWELEEGFSAPEVLLSPDGSATGCRVGFSTEAFATPVAEVVVTMAGKITLETE